MPHNVNSSLKKKTWSAVALSVIVLVAAYAYFLSLNQKYLSITNFKECVDAGYPLLEIYPEQCKMPGKSFTNPNQIRSVNQSGTVDQYKDDYLQHSYLLDGTPITIVSSSSVATTSFVVTDISHVGTLSDDSLEDRVFVVSKGTGTSTSYFLFLSLGLYSGGTAPANAIALGSDMPQSITSDSDGRIKVTIACKTAKQCFKTFIVRNDILEQSN